MPDPNLNNQPEASAQAPQIDTQSSPTGELQAPAAQPNLPQVAPAAAPEGMPPTATTKNPALHNLIGSVLGALSGKPGPSYSYDANGKLVTTPSAPLSTGDKVKRILNTAMTGLGAGSQVGDKGSAAANVAAGLGAGAAAVQKRDETQDLLKREQAKQNFEVEQQTMLRKHEIARQNALTMANYMANKKMANDMNPHFASNESLMNAVKASPELGAHVHELSDEQVNQEKEKDPNFLVTHIIKPLGWAPEIGPDGQQVMTTDEEGNSVPKFRMRMMVVDGTKDGKLAITPEMAADIRDYGPIARIPNAAGLKAGDSYDIGELLPVMNAVDAARKDVLQGWQHAELGWKNDAQGKPTIPVEVNKALPVGDPRAVRPLTVTPIEMKKEEATEAKDASEMALNKAKAQEALANAAALAQGLNGPLSKENVQAYMDAISKLPAQSQTILRNVPPVAQGALLAIANGDSKLNDAFTNNPRKTTGGISAAQAETLVKILNPNWRNSFYDDKKKAAEYLSSGAGAQGIRSFNQFLGHAGQAADIIKQYGQTNSALLNHSMNWFKQNFKDDPRLGQLQVALTASRDEWENMIKSGKAPTADEISYGKMIINEDIPLNKALAILGQMGSQGVTRLDNYNEDWKEISGQNWPNLVRETGIEGAQRLGIANQLSKYTTGGTIGGLNAPQGRTVGGGAPQPSATPAPQTHVFDSKAWAAANPGKDVNAAVAAAKAQGYEVK